jgi:hypothetical protein
LARNGIAASLSVNEMLCGELQAVCIHDAVTASREIFGNKLDELRLDAEPL